MARSTVWFAAGAAAMAVLGSGLGCGEVRAPSGAAANATAGCSSCHSGPGEAPPFRDPTGATNPALPAIGAHAAHLRSALSADLACESCHTVPRTVTDPGHLEDSPGDVQLGLLARTGGAAPTYDPQTRTCATAYCHGSFPGGTASNAPSWTAGAAAAACGSCHGIPPQTGAHQAHVGRTFGGTAITCATCHGDVVPATHVNGVKDVPLAVWNAGTRSCAGCHEEKQWEED